MEGFRATAWNTKDFNVGGLGLTRINFTNIASSTKFIDTLKYYQKSLSQLTKTATEEQKNAIKKLTRQFLVMPDYFGLIWKTATREEKNKLLETTANEKGIIPYENIVSQYSLDLEPENGDFFQKREFFSELKQKFVSDKDYENSYYLYKTLKMRNLNDMNDLYNAQNVVLLCEKIEDRLQLMYDKYRFNPRKCNSASTLSGCIEWDLSKVIIALPISNKIVEAFEKTLTGGFSCVKTSLPLDTEILLPNTDKMQVEGVDSEWKDYSYKVCYKLKLDNEERYDTKRVIFKILKRK